MGSTQHSQESSHKGSKTETNSLANYEPSSECGPSPYADNATVRTVAFRIHPKGKTQARNDSSNENEIQVVGLVSNAIQNMSEQGGSAGKM